MKTLTISAGLLAASMLWSVTLSAAEPTTQPQARTGPRVDVAFVLDTTGSMSGLIEGAKAKIWFIANQIVLGKPRPVVRMALVAYRDKGDQYVTRVFDLTDNIDQVYKDLTEFKADGGGDTPEHVNKALQDAVEKLSWTADSKALKIIYLVGDSPPHNEYTDTPTYDKLAKAAIEKGIYVNTILCGNNQQTAKIWQEIAQAAEGKFVAIEQSGGVVAVRTPFDDELAKLNREVVSTVVVYGSVAEQRAAAELNKAAAATQPDRPGAEADRASFVARTGRAGTQDLVQALKDGTVKLGELKSEELPQPMQKMTPQEQAKFIADAQARRDEVNARIKDLAAQRDAFIRKELEKSDRAKGGFDARVLDALREQARQKDLTYE